PGRYAGVAYGTNDAGWNVSPAAFYDNYVVMIQAVLAAGKIPIVPRIPWGCTSNILANVPVLNQKIDALYAAYPQIIRGPDLWAYFQANQSQISADCVHPSDQGDFGMRRRWADTMLASVYAAPSPSTLQLTSSTSTPTAGTSFSFTVTAQDRSGKTDPAYGGRVHFTSSDAAAGVVLPADSTLTNGQGTFSATLMTAGAQTITATDTVTAATTGSLSVTVRSPSATRLVVSSAATPTAGAAFSFTVTAQDQSGATDTTYAGTVHFTSSDTSLGVLLPADTTLGNGQGAFSATLIKAGSQTITGTDTATASINGTLSVTVRAASAASLALDAPRSATAGQAFTVAVTLKDPYGNVATGYRGTVHFAPRRGISARVTRAKGGMKFRRGVGQANRLRAVESCCSAPKHNKRRRSIGSVSQFQETHRSRDGRRPCGRARRGARRIRRHHR